MMKKRDPKHPMSAADIRVSDRHETEFKKGQEIICLSTNLFGLVGKVDNVDSKKHIVYVNIDKQKEESKVHNPFLGQKLIADWQGEATKESSL